MYSTFFLQWDETFYLANCNSFQLLRIEHVNHVRLLAYLSVLLYFYEQLASLLVWLCIWCYLRKHVFMIWPITTDFLNFCSYSKAKQRYLRSREELSPGLHLASAAEAGGLVSIWTSYPLNLLQGVTSVYLSSQHTVHENCSDLGWALLDFYRFSQLLMKMKGESSLIWQIYSCISWYNSSIIK